MAGAETPTSPIPVVGECHTEVPAGGISLYVPPAFSALKGMARYSLVSARFSNMDGGALFATTETVDVVAKAKKAWESANATKVGSLFASHVNAMQKLHAPGIEVDGNVELARVVNSSIHALLGSYRSDSAYSSAPEGVVSRRYFGDALWDVETWQWPTWLAFWPQTAQRALQYRVDRLEQAAKNAKRPAAYSLPDWPAGDASAPRLQGLRYPWMSALSGVEQCPYNSEDHIQGDIATAFRTHYYATLDRKWLEKAGFPVIQGIAAYYASRVTRDPEVPSRYHILHTMGPDEYHGNISDSAYGNAVAAAALRGAYELASAAGQVPNTTFLAIAEGLVIPFNATAQYHPEYRESEWNARQNQLIKQADTVLMYYPLGHNASDTVKRNDLRYYEKLQDRGVNGVAMTWGVQSIVSLDIGDKKEAARYFRLGYEAFARPPFYTWHEQNATEGSTSQGAPNLVTGAGGFLQSVWAGYGGVRFTGGPGVLTLRSPRPIPGSKRLKLRGLHFLGARLDIEATAGEWSVALSASSPKEAPALQLAMQAGAAAEMVSPVRITQKAIRRKEGEVAHVELA